MAQPLRIALGADHGGFDLKQQLVVYLQGQGHQIRDCGTNSTEAVDYPVFAESVARLAGSGDCDFGIVVDGAGIGSAMAANKVPSVLAAACYNEALARNSREHNGANVLALGSGQVTVDQAKAIVDVFLTTACSAKRHQRRVEMIRDIERRALMAGGTGGTVDLSGEDLQRIADRVRQLLQDRQPAAAPGPPPIPPDALARMIDHTLLKPDATAADIEKLCDEAKRAQLLLGLREPDLRRAVPGAAARLARSRSAASSASRWARSRPRSRRSRRARPSATARAKSTW